MHKFSIVQKLTCAKMHIKLNSQIGA